MAFDLESYLSRSVEGVVKNAIRASLKNPRESLFMAKYAVHSKTAADRRRKAADRGEHIPPFLIASITSACNLHCAGCYARANHACVDAPPVGQLTGEDWGDLFAQAVDLGIGFILLAGGEPMLRRDVLDQAARHPEILFPVFTNGTMFSREYLTLFDRHRNLVPILSIEGSRDTTDTRRGAGVHAQLQDAMARMKQAGVLFGASVTVTTENVEEVLSDAFVQELYDAGCQAVIYVEFVPVTQEAAHLAPGDAQRDYVRAHLNRLRLARPDMVMISFPGDEKGSGGCLAAGRGFFHINAQGGAEPCPFSPYSDSNVKTLGLRGALNSPLFRGLRDGGLLLEDHAGGCVLFERREQVESLLG